MQPNVQNPDDRMGDHTGGKSVIYQRLLTFAEYLALVPQSRSLLETRLREIRIPPDDLFFFVAYPRRTRLLAVVADDTPSTVVVLPVIAHVAAQSPRLDLRVVREAEAADLLIALTGDAQAGDLLTDAALPRLLIFDDQWQIHALWGPHPKEIESYRARGQSPDTNPAQHAPAQEHDRLTHELRLWYNSGLNERCAAELRALLAALHPAEGDPDGGTA